MIRSMLPALLALALSPLAMAASTVPAEPAAGDAPAAAAPAAEAKPAKICTRERPMGSNRSVRVCRDAADVERSSEEAREAVQRMDTGR